LIDCSPIPGLLGLRTNYISAQLGAWRYGTRTAAAPDCMQIVAGHLTEDDVKALAAWLSSRPTRLKLSAPFSWRIAEPLDTNATG
jgi:cytochrome c553